MNYLPPKKLGEMSPKELLESAAREFHGLDEFVDTLPLGDSDKLVLGAYVGSVGSRLLVALKKMEDES
jgi:hypothetical protein